MDKFFRSYPQYADEVRDNIYHKLPDIINFRPHKIKPAWHLKRNGQTIFEYKIAAKHKTCKTTTRQTARDINLCCCTTVTSKRQFVHQLESPTLTG